MTDEAQELRREIRKRSSRQSIVIGALTAGVVASVIAVYIGMRGNAETIDKTRAALEDVQNSLKVTCDVAEKDQNRRLPVSVREDCERAEDNELPNVVEDIDDPEQQDPEQQDPEVQDGEVQDPEIQDPELQDPEIADPDPNDPENQEDEIQDEDPNDPDPVDDPDPNDPDPVDDPDPNDPGQICNDGYTAQNFRYFGPDGIDNTGDEQDWQICMRNP